jgi:hypothetical protein
VTMRMRADQIQTGHCIDGALVTRVRPTLDWGMVHITLENADSRRPDGIANGTFCFLADDILEVERSSRSATVGSPGRS